MQLVNIQQIRNNENNPRIIKEEQKQKEQLTCDVCGKNIV
jgi:hypothetical protein